MQYGYTLIELLLYVSILGSLLIAVSMYFALTADSRVKNQSIVEVDQQGALLMEQIAQTIRNADSITSPAVGATGDSLTLVVPTGSLSPTIISNDGSGGSGGGTSVLGYDQDGGTTDSLNGNHINATRFVASVSGTVTTLHARVGSVDASPSDKAQMAIYSGELSPSTFLESSVTTILTPNAWNTFTINPTTITAGTTYWLAYNTNTGSAAQNNLRYHVGTSGQSMFQTQTYNSWPSSWLGTYQDVEFSMYATVSTTGSVGAAQIKEGAAAAIPITNSKVLVSNLSFKNLSRPGTPGIVQISFTISRANPNGRNEYSYEKTFTTSVAVRN